MRGKMPDLHATRGLLEKRTFFIRGDAFIVDCLVTYISESGRTIT